MSILQEATDALYSLLSLVPSESGPTLAGSALPGNMRPLRLVAGLGFLELLPLVPTEFDSEVGR